MSEVIKISTDVHNGTIIQPDVVILQLVNENDGVLRTCATQFDFENPPFEPVEFASQLVETCKVKGGFGLAAPQVGISTRLFVMGSGDEYVAMFNPSILEQSKEQSLVAEGCLSFPMLALKISRPKSIKVEYYDYNGKRHESEFEGLTAHIFQHELDHLDGICYTDRVKPMALKMGLKKRSKFSKLVTRYESVKKRLNSLSE